MPKALRSCNGRSATSDRTALQEAIRRAADPVVLMQRVADEALKMAEGAEGVLVYLAHDSERLFVECASGHVRERTGSTIPIDASLSGLAFLTGETLRCDDAESDDRVERNLCHAFGIASSLCVPLWRGERTVGVFSVTSSRPHAFDDRAVATITGLAEFISVVIAVAVELKGVTDALLTRALREPAPAEVAADWEAEERFMANVLNPGAMNRFEARSRIDRFLKGRGLSHVFQPVFDLTSGECFAVEALARFAGQPRRTPDVWFAEAHELGVGLELELESVRAALRHLPRLPGDVALCLNAGPAAMVSDTLRQILALSETRRLVMELTEESKVDDYPVMSTALGQLGLMGVRLAIDDTGAGFASLAHILKLAPQLIKLDRELTSGIDHDPVRIALATALVSFASGLGAEIIAEGIETSEELEVLRGLGIRYGQGYYLCRPTSADEIPTRLSPETMSLLDRQAS